MIMFACYWFPFANILHKRFVLLFMRETGVQFSFLVTPLGLALR